MIFFVGNDGTVIKSVPSPVYQGAANANNIYLIAPFAENMTVTVAFKLPNGVWTDRRAMAELKKIDGVIDSQTGKTYAGWSYALPNEITKYYGTVTAQFFFYAAQSRVVTATSAVTFSVARGVPEILPEEPSADVYAAILGNITSLQTQLNNGAYAARAIYAWNSTYSYNANEITYYPDIGLFGAFVKSKASGNLNNPPYNAAGELNSRYWEVILDFNQLNKAIVIWGFNEAVDISDLEWEVE